ncbi:uncharacterized protein LOC135366433 isoform X2 [Ornithodoros turicata]|uniref:uncharacterized protein LOC135366433 isoform X2 n=1 Tax=Ornithodoros turicata TaxID=34597 RepID=UPI0031386965
MLPSASMFSEDASANMAKPNDDIQQDTLWKVALALGGVLAQRSIARQQAGQEQPGGRPTSTLVLQKKRPVMTTSETQTEDEHLILPDEPFVKEACPPPAVLKEGRGMPLAAQSTRKPAAVMGGASALFVMMVAICLFFVAVLGSNMAQDDEGGDEDADIGGSLRGEGGSENNATTTYVPDTTSPERRSSSTLSSSSSSFLSSISSSQAATSTLTTIVTSPHTTRRSAIVPHGFTEPCDILLTNPYGVIELTPSLRIEKRVSWCVFAPPGQHIHVMFLRLNLTDGYRCPSESVRLYDGGSPAATLVRIACGIYIPLPVDTKGNLLYVLYVRRGHRPAGIFKALYNVVQNKTSTTAKV